MKTISKLALGFLASMTVTAAMAQTPRVNPAAPSAQPGAVKKEINREEVLAHASKRFDRADTNKDGVLSAEERKIARERLRAKHRVHHGERKEPRGEAHRPQAQERAPSAK